MAVPVKSLLAGTAVIGTGSAGVGLIYRGLPPKASQLATDSSFVSGVTGSGAYKDKYASKYANFLVGIDDANNDWGNWSFANRYSKTEAKGAFKNVVGGVKKEDQNDNSLKTACDNAYKADSNNVVESITDDGEVSKFLKSQVGKYCSFLVFEDVPKTLKDMNDKSDSNEDKTKLSDTNNGGGGNTSKIASSKKDDLLAIYTGENDLAGELLEHRFSSS